MEKKHKEDQGLDFYQNLFIYLSFFIIKKIDGKKELFKYTNENNSMIFS